MAFVIGRVAFMLTGALLFTTTVSAYAHEEDFIDETLVFATLEADAVEPQYWFDIGRNDSGNFMRHSLAVEYGITDHWMVDCRATGIDERRDGFHLDSSRLETRYRFFNEDTLPVDIAVSGEINSRRDEEGHRIIDIEPRLILSKGRMRPAMQSTTPSFAAARIKAVI